MKALLRIKEEGFLKENIKIFRRENIYLRSNEKI